MSQAKSTNYKCVKNSIGEVYRIKNNQIKDALAKGFTFCPRSEWKKVRDTGSVKTRHFEKRSKI